jgi:hypothetical protein
MTEVIGENNGGEYALDDCSCVVDIVGVRVGQLLHDGRVHPPFIGGRGRVGARSYYSGPPGVMNNGGTICSNVIKRETT